MDFFSGATFAKLDEKNRFVLPQALRYGLIEDGKLSFHLALGEGGCLVIYRNSEIESIAKAFAAKQHVSKYRRFFTLFFSTMHTTTCDKVGRLLVPPSMKSFAGIQSEVVVAGVLNKIEIWPKEVYEKDIQAVMEGCDPEYNFGKLAQEAFSLLNVDESEERGSHGAHTSAS